MERLHPDTWALADARPRTKHFSGSLLLFSVVGLVGAAIFWAAHSEIDEVTTGQGRVVPSLQTQVVQSLEGGIVQRIAVREGAIVNVGDLLVQLDHTILGSQYNQGRAQYFALMAKVQRLQAEVNVTDLTFTDEVRKEAPAVVASQSTLYAARRAEMESEVRILQRQIYQKQQELEEAKVNFATADRGLVLSNRERTLVQPLVARGLEADTTLLRIDQAISDFKGRQDSASLATLRLGSGIHEVQDRIEATVDHFRSSALQDLSDATAKLAELDQSLPALQDRAERTEIRSPVKGVVNRVLVTTVGGVAQPGMPLVEIVPMDDALLIEAYVKPADIAFLRPGQEVKVKLTAYDYARYGALDGKLETISADAIRLPDTKDSMYKVQVRTLLNHLGGPGQEMPVSPGMVAQVDILSGKRTVLDYIVRPVLRLRDSAFRDSIR